MMITRETLSECDPQALFGSLTNGQYLSASSLLSSLMATLERRPPGPVWVFAYGSLIWNPALHYVERQDGFLKKWSRAFCMKLTAGRGTQQNPGRMLGVVPGTGVHGALFRLAENDLTGELLLLWKREMCTASYLPAWEEAELADGRKVTALVFTMAQDHPSYESEYAPSAVAEPIAYANGPLGTNAEYLLKLDQALNAERVRDVYVRQVALAVQHLKLSGVPVR